MRFAAAALVVAACAYRAFAGEPLTHTPKIDHAIEKAINNATKSSEGLLGQLDSLLEKKGYAAQDWQKICMKAIQEADGLEAEILKICKEKKIQTSSIEVQPALMWLAGHRDSWGRVSSIGHAAAWEYDYILSGVKLLEDTEIPRAKTFNGWVEVTTKALSVVATEAETNVDLNVGEIPVEDLLDKYDKVAESCDTMVNEEAAGSILTSILIRHSDELKEFLRLNDPAGFRKRVDEVINQDIDPDGAGVFLRHEKKWEKELLRALELFNKQHMVYTDIVEPIKMRYLKFQAERLKSATVNSLSSVWSGLLSDLEDVRDAIKARIDGK